MEIESLRLIFLNVKLHFIISRVIQISQKQNRADRKKNKSKIGYSVPHKYLKVRDGHQDGGMHKSSEHSESCCVWNEDAPTVVSCVHFRFAGACGHLQPQALFVSRRPAWTERTLH